MEAWHEGVTVVLEQWELGALLVAGVLGSVFQQVSLATNRQASCRLVMPKAARRLSGAQISSGRTSS